MALDKIENIEKAQKQVEKLNEKFVKNAIKKKNERHVKEENEPVLDVFLDNFRTDYAKTVVGKSMKEIVKFLKDKDV